MQLWFHEDQIFHLFLNIFPDTCIIQYRTLQLHVSLTQTNKKMKIRTAKTPTYINKERNLEQKTNLFMTVSQKLSDNSYHD